MRREAEGLIDTGLSHLVDAVERTRAELVGLVAEVAVMTEETLRRGGTLFFCGNGGSAADAQHLAAEYVVRFRETRRGLPAIALTVDSSVLTAGANDFGFEQVFARQVEALGRPGDLLFLHSTSGESKNLLAAAGAARARGIRTVAFLARGGGRLREEVDTAVVVPVNETARAQEVHLALAHLVCEWTERCFVREEQP